MGFKTDEKGYAQTPCLENGSNFSRKIVFNSFLYYSDNNCTKKYLHMSPSGRSYFWNFFSQYWISFLYLLRFVSFLGNFCAYFLNNTLEVATPEKKNKECWPFLPAMLKSFGRLIWVCLYGKFLEMDILDNTLTVYNVPLGSLIDTVALG